MNEPNTVRVRIAVAVDEKGNWRAVGWNWTRTGDAECMMESASDEFGEGRTATHWVDADVPLPPRPQVFKGSVTPAEEG